MRVRNQLAAVVGLVFAISMFIGCPSEPTPPATPPETPPATPPETPPETPSGSTDNASSGATDDAASKDDAAQVLLGDPSLTAGIPGEGELTTDQIKAWIDNEDNHVALNVTLPLGLDAGQGEIKGLDENPLTRAKIELGRQLFFDTRLSVDNTISCASCHEPDHGYAAETKVGVGVGDQTGPVNSPVAYNRILSDLQFWDGRAATLEEQAKGPIQAPNEMGNTHEQAVATVNDIEGYRLQFDKVFSGEEITIDSIVKAIASFERALVTGPSPFDYAEALNRYAKYSDEDLEDLKKEDPGEYERYEQAKTAAAANPMSESATRGHKLFISDKSNCSTCHLGANLTDEKYHNVGVGMDAEEPNLGRFTQTNDEKDKGAFKTPTIRNTAVSPPYMHDGSMNTLAEVVEHYVKGGTPNAWLSKDITKLDLSAQDKADLVEFMKACTGELPPVETGRLPK